MANIKQVVIDGTTYNLKDPIARSCIAFGEVDSTSTATAFTATIPGITEYFDGLAIMLKNGVVTSASGFTIDINGLGAKHSYNNMAAATADTTLFNINYTMLFVYDSTRVSGGGWICYRGYDANTNTIGYQLRTNSRTRPVTDQTGRYRILFSSADNSDWVPPNTSSSTSATAAKTVNQRPINPWGEIAYYSYTTVYAAGTNVGTGYMWSQYIVALGYSFNRTGAALTMTFPAPVYVKCAPQANGSAIIDETNPFVQELPNTADGKIYIYLGNAYSATNIELVNWHPVYYHDGTGIRIWTGKVIPTKTSELTNDSGFITTETDPTVPAWAKASAKPTYTASEVGALPDNTTYVSSFNGSSGAITYTAPVTSVNGSTGAVTVNEDYLVTVEGRIPSGSTDYTYTADKTFAQITAAAQAGKRVVVLYYDYANDTTPNKWYQLELTRALSSGLHFGGIGILTATANITSVMYMYLKITSADAISLETKTASTSSNYSASSTNAMNGVAVASAISGKQDTANLVTSLSSSSTDDTYPSAKAVYDAIPTVPATVSSFTNDAGYVTASTAPVTSVNSKTGAVSLTASDVGALPDSTVIPSAVTNSYAADAYSGKVMLYSSTSSSSTVTSTKTCGALDFTYTSSTSIGELKIGKSSTDEGVKGSIKLSNAASMNNYTIITPTAAAEATISLPSSTGTLALTSQIPTVPTTVSSFTNDAGYLTLATLPIYDGTVV